MPKKNYLEFVGLGISIGLNIASIILTLKNNAQEEKRKKENILYFKLK